MVGYGNSIQICIKQKLEYSNADINYIDVFITGCKIACFGIQISKFSYLLPLVTYIALICRSDIYIWPPESVQA